MLLLVNIGTVNLALNGTFNMVLASTHLINKYTYVNKLLVVCLQPPRANLLYVFDDYNVCFCNSSMFSFLFTMRINEGEVNTIITSKHNRV